MLEDVEAFLRVGVGFHVDQHAVAAGIPQYDPGVKVSQGIAVHKDVAVEVAPIAVHAYPHALVGQSYREVIESSLVDPFVDEAFAALQDHGVAARSDVLDAEEAVGDDQAACLRALLIHETQEHAALGILAVHGKLAVDGHRHHEADVDVVAVAGHQNHVREEELVLVVGGERVIVGGGDVVGVGAFPGRQHRPEILAVLCAEEKRLDVRHRFSLMVHDLAGKQTVAGKRLSQTLALLRLCVADHAADELVDLAFIRGRGLFRERIVELAQGVFDKL